MTEKELKNLKKKNNWKEANPRSIATHFHTYIDKEQSTTDTCPTQSGYYRANVCKMDKDCVPLFEIQIKEGITDIKIHMALDSDSDTNTDRSKENTYSFNPIIEFTPTNKKNDSPTSYTLISKRTPSNDASVTSDLVPEIFKNHVVHNWNEIDTHLIEDLFLAKSREDANQKLRVQHFKISNTMIEHINTILTDTKNTITEVSLYLGIDMNKFGDNSKISFTPVLGFKIKKNLPDDYLTFPGIVNRIEKEIYIEYSTPCPPTC